MIGRCLHGLLALSLVAPACAVVDEPAPAPAPPDDELAIPGFEDFFDGKGDTGYVGNRAFEIEASLSGRVRVSVPDKTDDELLDIAEALLENPRSWEHRAITSQITQQIKYARNRLRDESLNLNLEGGNPSFTSIEVIGGGLELSYSIRIESLVKYKDLESRNLTVEDLVGRTVALRLPLVPEGLFERVGAACATDAETGQPVDPEELGAHNLFYYFDPDRDGCPLGDADLAPATYTVESSLDAPTVYPEYDLLVADGRIDMVVIFGQIKHGELESNDWGFISFRDMTSRFERLGFRRVQTYEDNRGHRLERTYPAGLTVSIDMYTPVGFADHVPREEANERFRDAIRQNEIVYYNGHAFYGSLSVLDDRSVYPEGTYQIILMDACWSYAYYTKQIFRNRATDEDPDGYAWVDVVNNTEPGITGSETTAVVLWDNVFRGAAAVRAGSDASLYSWNHIITYMNEHAEARAARRTTYPDPEIYGVSGVLDNRYRPGRTSGGGSGSSGQRWGAEPALDIPDNDTAGVTSTIAVPAGQGGPVSGMVVRATIEHTYIGDLLVALAHGGRTLTLHDRTGGGTDNLEIQLASEHFAGLDREGDWSLTVVDTARLDEGRIVSWSIEIAE